MLTADVPVAQAIVKVITPTELGEVVIIALPDVIAVDGIGTSTGLVIIGFDVNLQTVNPVDVHPNPKAEEVDDVVVA